MSEPRISDETLAHDEALRIERRDAMAQRLFSAFREWPVPRSEVWGGFWRVADVVLAESDAARAALAEAQRERDEALRDNERVLADRNGAREDAEEAQRENGRLTDEVRTYQIALAEKGTDVEHLRHWLAEWQKKAEEAEQHVAVLRDALLWAWGFVAHCEKHDLDGFREYDGAKFDALEPFIESLRAGNTAAGSAAWLAAHDAEKDARIAAMLPWSTFGAAVWKRIRDGFWESEESWEVAQLAVEAGIAERVPYDPEKHGEMDAAPGDEIIYPKDVASLPVDAEKDAQIAALVAALRRIMAYLGSEGEDATEQELSRKQAMDALANLPAAAAAYTADVRRASLEPVSKVLDALALDAESLEYQCSGNATAVATARLMRQRIRALAAQPEGK